MITLPAGCYVTLFPLSADIVMCRIKPLGSFGEREVCFHGGTVEEAIAGASKLYLELPEPIAKKPKVIVKVATPCISPITVKLPGSST